jgi:two-component system response regulator FixJ
MTEQQTLYIVDDEQPVRKALSLLARADGLKSESFDSAKAFLEVLERIGPGCLLLDVCMPDMTGLELQKELRERGVDLPVIVITGHGDVPTAVQAMKAGAADFVEKPLDSVDLMVRVHNCLNGEAERRQTQQGIEEARALLALLTPRERQVMEGLVAGRRNKQIARDLFISFRTVELHRAKVMEKLQANSLSDVVRVALVSQSV